MFVSQSLRRYLAAGTLCLAGVTVAVTLTSPPATPALAGAPSSSDGLFLHWDASASASLRDVGGGSIEHGEQVGHWIDLASGVTASASVAGYGPTAGPTYSTTNGQPLLDFDGSSAGLTTAPLPLFTGASSGLTVIAVIRPTDVIDQRFVLMHATGNCTSNVELGVSTGHGGDGNWGLHRGCGNAVVTPDSALTANQPAHVVTRLGTTGTNPNHVSFRINGSIIAPQTNSTGWVEAGSYPTGSDRLRIGWRDDTGANATPNSFFRGEVSELLVFDRPLSDARVIEIETHLTAKWQAGAFVPRAVTDLATSATQDQATVSWTAADGRGTAVTGYDVTVSAGGTVAGTCTLRGAPPATTCVVGGLSASTPYLVSVSATNTFGVGAVSTTNVVTSGPPPLPALLPTPTTPTEVTAPSTSLAPTPPSTIADGPPTTRPPGGTPDTAPPPSVPQADSLAPGLVRGSVEGIPVALELEQRTTEQWSLSGPEFRVDLRLQSTGGGAVADGVIRLLAGARALTSGEGFGANTMVDVWLFSEPRLIARLPVDGQGRFEGELPLPSDVPAGPHTLQVDGVTADGLRRSISLGLLVETSPGQTPTPGVLPATGPAVAVTVMLSWFLAATGGVALLRTRRRNLN